MNPAPNGQETRKGKQTMISPYTHTIAKAHYESLRRQAARSSDAQILSAALPPQGPGAGTLARLGRTLIILGGQLERRYGPSHPTHFVNAQE